MAKVQFINGILSGKLAGTVYARNRLGYYVRYLAKPINPKTIAQINARVGLSQATQSFHALTDGEKVLWQNFASTIFKAKFPVIGMNYSAINAFASLRNSVYNAQRKMITNAVWEINGETETSIANTFANETTPPTDALELNCCGTGHLGSPMLLGSGTISNNTGVISVAATITFTEPITGFTALKDSKGTKFGLGVYVSNSMTQAWNHAPNPGSQCLIVVPPFSITPAITDPVETCSFSGTSPVQSYDLRRFADTDNFVRFDLYQISQTGMTNLIGSLPVQIQEP